ncbi:MAG: N-acetylmuramoyl-L-alanine amidase [Verrucomicrobiota bacterium]
MKNLLIKSLMLCATAVASEHLIVIDPGHGGSKSSGTQSAHTLSSANNATSPSGLKEKDLTLELSKEIAKQIELLAKSYPETKIECIFTRSDDTNPDFAQRAMTCANTRKTPSAILSIHFNASESHDALGTLAVIRHKKINTNYERDHEFAMHVTNATSSAVSLFVDGSKPKPPITDAHLHNGAGSNFFWQLARHESLSKVPKCFLEVEFMDRKDVESKLLKTKETTFPVIGKAIAESLYAYCTKKSDESASKQATLNPSGASAQR